MKTLLLIFGGILITASVYSQSWSLTGNAGTTNSNFIGTTDSRPLIFRSGVAAGYTGYAEKENVAFGWNCLVNTTLNGNGNTAMGAGALRYSQSFESTAFGRWAGLYNWGEYNVMLGMGALTHTEAASLNVAIGIYALMQNKTDGNTAIGTFAVPSVNTGVAITATGHYALSQNSTGSYNTANGYKALSYNTSGEKNVAIGNQALFNNTIGFKNTAIGMESLYYNTTGDDHTAIGYRALFSNTTGVWNAACGSESLYFNTLGILNTAAGSKALRANTEGNENTAAGYLALGGNVKGDANTAVGTRALLNDTTIIGHGNSDFNTAIGWESLKGLTTGSFNTATGLKALHLNAAGYSNTALGAGALSGNTTGSYNTALGAGALSGNTTGSYNTAIGYGTNVNNGGLTNATAIGNGALATASNQVTIGNSSVTSIRGYANWATISDGRVKKNIRQDVPGLEFINKLQPVTYNLDLDAADRSQSKAPSQEEIKLRETASRIVHTGFVAQDVERIVKSLGYDFSGVDVDETDKSLYGLRYDEFVIPLVKAVQELSARNDAKDAYNTSLQSQINELKKQVSQLLDQ